MIEGIMNAVMLMFLLYSFYKIIKLKDENEKINAELREHKECLATDLRKDTAQAEVKQPNTVELKPIEEAEAQSPKRKKRHIPARQIKRQSVKHRG